MNVNELFQEMENNNVLLNAIDETVYCTLDEQNREIILPSEYQIIGVESDEKVERLKFQFPKIVGDNIDLSRLSIRINYKNANGEIDKNVAENITSDDESIYFDWVLTRKVTKYKGTVNFIACAVKTNSDGTITNKWNTTLAKSEVLEGLEVSGDVIEQENPDIIEYILSKLDEIEQGGIGGGAGKDGREIELQNNGIAIQWRYVGDAEWIDLVQLSDLKGDKGDAGEAVNGIPSGGTTGQVLAKKSDSDYDAEWKDAPTEGQEQYFELTESGSTTTNGVSLDITGLIGNYPDYDEWDSIGNWYRVSYNTNSIPVKNGLPAEKLISKPIKGVPYFRAFSDSENQYALNNTIAFYGCDSGKALEEEGHQCSLCAKKYVYTPVDQLPDGTKDAGVIVAYPQESFDYYYIRIESGFYSTSNTGKYNRSNPTHICVFDSSVLDNPLLEIGSNTESFLKMKDEYLDGYYKNMFSSDAFKNIFKTYYAQMAPKVGLYQTYRKAIYIGGDSLHDYSGGDGVSEPGFVTKWNQYLNFSVCKNDGYAGSTWTELTGGGGLKRAKDLISDGTVYDVVVLAWGTNDDTGGNGTIDDPASDTEGCTMVAAMKWIITNLHNTFKKTAIGVIIPPPKNTEDGMKEKGDLMIQVCEQLHVPYKDMRNYISISDLGSDAVHLGTGSDKYGAAEASLVLDICPYGDTLYPGK